MQFIVIYRAIFINLKKMNKRESLFMLTVLFWITNLDCARTAVSDDYDDYVPDVEEDVNDDDAECKLGEFRFDQKLGLVTVAAKVEEGGVIEMQCRVCGAGSSLLHIEWLKDNLPPREWTATNGREFLDKEYKLRINKCETNDTGNYTCVIDDQSNMKRLSRTYEVIVKKKILPSQFISESPHNATVKIGDSHSFKCRVSDSSLSVYWYRGSDSLPNVTNVRKHDAVNFEKGVSSEELKIASVSLDDAGWYSCIVMDDHNNTAGGFAYLTVIDPPWYSQYWFYFILVSILVIVVSLVVAAFFRYQKVKNSRKYSPGNEMINTTTQA